MPEAGEREITLSKGDIINTYTYINLFDSGHWHEFTGIDDFFMEFEYKGRAELVIKMFYEGRVRETCRKSLESRGWRKSSLKLTDPEEYGQYFFELRSEGAFSMRNAVYTDHDPAPVDPGVTLGLVICTYDAKNELLRNLKKLKDSFFFKKNMAGGLDSLYGKLYIYITDNKGELPRKPLGNVSIIHNRNTGGTGGFSKGLEELKKNRNRTGISHVIFMDDDVDFDSECFYRLFALLSRMKKEHKERPVAGRMFEPDGFSQFTALEVWNKGYVKHIGHDLDMTEERNLSDVNDIMKPGAEDIVYGGWWFSCVPFEFAGNNTPLPFFLHCDDVEYGIRIGASPVILNGIEVLHDTPENKASPLMAYYDARNMMIVNSVYGLAGSSELLEQWKNRLSSFHEKHDLDSIGMTVLAMHHFLKGPQWFLRVNGERLHKELKKRDFSELRIYDLVGRVSYKLMWRTVYAWSRIKISGIMKKYEGLKLR